MKLSDILKILTLLAVATSTILSIVGDMFPANVVAVLNALVAAIFVFVKKLGGESPQ